MATKKKTAAHAGGAPRRGKRKTILEAAREAAREISGVNMASGPDRTGVTLSTADGTLKPAWKDEMERLQRECDKFNERMQDKARISVVLDEVHRSGEKIDLVLARSHAPSRAFRRANDGLESSPLDAGGVPTGPWVPYTGEKKPPMPPGPSALRGEVRLAIERLVCQIHSGKHSPESLADVARAIEALADAHRALVD